MKALGLSRSDMTCHNLKTEKKCINIPNIILNNIHSDLQSKGHVLFLSLDKIKSQTLTEPPAG